jgi:hypothetical protein
MRTTTFAIACLVALAGLAAVPVALADDAPSATCTLSYPATCTVRADGVRVTCSGVGAVPECRA